MRNGVNQYAENIKKMGLTDLEIFMKVQDDMHKSIEGYGAPKLDIEGYFGVDIGQENGTGVCRNMADDIVNKLNAINKDYNARMFIVKAMPGETDDPNIRKNYAEMASIGGTEFDSTSIRNIVHFIYYTTNNKDVYDVIGNHAVVAVDLKQENITLIIDPTNTCLGVFKDGKITIFNSLSKEEPYSMYRTPLDDLAYRGVESLEVPSEYVKSFLNPFVSIDEVNKEYGIEAQQKALESSKIKEEDYIYQSSQPNRFKNNLKVDIEETKESVYSIEEIKSMYDECMLKVLNANTAEEVIELGNIFRKITYSISYYNQQQEEIIGKTINYYAMISTEIDLDITKLQRNIAKKMVETNAVVLSEDPDIKEFLCIAYLQAGEQERIQDLKVVFNEKEDNYYILNSNGLLATVNAKYNEEGDLQGVSYDKNYTKTENEVAILLDESISIMRLENQNTNVIAKDNVGSIIEER